MLAIALGRNQSFRIHEPISKVYTLKAIDPGRSATLQIDLGDEMLILWEGTDHQFEYAPGLWGTLGVIGFKKPNYDQPVTKVIVGVRLPRAIKVTF